MDEIKDFRKSMEFISEKYENVTQIHPLATFELSTFLQQFHIQNKILKWITKWKLNVYVEYVEYVLNPPQYVLVTKSKGHNISHDYTLYVIPFQIQKCHLYRRRFTQTGAKSYVGAHVDEKHAELVFKCLLR